MYRAGSTLPRERFLDQFEMDSGDWVYRHQETGPAYRVTDAEKDDFVAAFDRQQKRLGWIVGAILLGFFLGLLVVTRSDSWPPFWLAFYVALFVPQLVIDHATFRAPARALEHRTPVAPALSRPERRRLTLERLPDTVLIGTTTITLFLLLYFALERPAIGPKGWAFIVACGVALVWAIVQGTRKWLLTRADYAANNLI